MKFAKILVPIEGKTAENEAIRLASQIAKQDKAKVVLAYVIEIQRAMPLDAENGTLVQQAELVLEHAKKLAKAMGTQPECELLQARMAGPVLLDEAVERGVDLIILGISYRQPLGDINLGTTTNYILKNAPCRVWLCREAAGVDKK